MTLEPAMQSPDPKLTDAVTLLEHVRANPGCSMTEATTGLGWWLGCRPAPRMSVAVAVAVERGLVTTSCEGRGRETRCRLWAAA